MKPLEEIAKPCTRKVRVNSMGVSKSNTDMNHSLYNCIDCQGTPGSCPNYVDHNALIDKYGGGR